MIYCSTDMPVEYDVFPKKGSGKLTLKGCPGRIMSEYRALTHIILYLMGSDALLNATRGVIYDDLSGFEIDIDFNKEGDA